MSPQAKLEAFAQSVYLATKNRYYDDIEGEDGQVFVAHIIDWTNQYLDELEFEVNPDGTPVEFDFLRQASYALGTAVGGASSVVLPTAVDRVLTDEQRYVQVLQDGTPVSNWAVVAPSNISSKTNRITEDMCAVVGRTLLFSRPFTDSENQGDVVGDVTIKLPRMSTTNVKVLDIVRPKQLLILGVGKNSTLPDIVQGKLSPSFVQKYNRLLQSVIARSNTSSRSDQLERQSFEGVRGVGI